MCRWSRSTWSVARDVLKLSMVDVGGSQKFLFFTGNMYRLFGPPLSLYPEQSSLQQNTILDICHDPSFLRGETCTAQSVELHFHQIGHSTGDLHLLKHIIFVIQSLQWMSRIKPKLCKRKHAKSRKWCLRVTISLYTLIFFKNLFLQVLVFQEMTVKSAKSVVSLQQAFVHFFVD